MSCIIIELIKWRKDRIISNYYTFREWPIIGIGATYKDKNEPIRLLRKIFDDVNKPRYPVRFWLGTKLFMIITDPEDLKIIFNSDKCLNKSEMYDYLPIPLSLVRMEKEKWRADRRAYNPSFRSSVLNQFIPTLNRESTNLCNALAQLSEYDAGTQFDALLTRSVFQQLGETVYASNHKLSISEAISLRKSITISEAAMKKRFFSFWYHWDFIYKWTSHYQDEISATTIGRECVKKAISGFNRNEPIDDDKRSLTMVQVIMRLFQNGQKSEEYVFDNLFLLFSAGTMTTIISMNYILLMLAIHQDCQERAVEELHSIFQTADEPVTLDALQKMSYIDMIVREGIRLFPALPMISRKNDEDIEITHGIIPKGTLICIMLHMINRDPKYWGANAKEFYPERFHPDNMHNVNSYSYVSFSKGPRNCIGGKYGMMALKTLLAHLLRNFKLTTTIKMHEVRFHFHISAFMTEQRPFEIQKRKF